MPATLQAHVPAIEIAFGENISCSKPRGRSLRPFSIAGSDWATIDEFRRWFVHR